MTTPVRDDVGLILRLEEGCAWANCDMDKLQAAEALRAIVELIDGTYTETARRLRGVLKEHGVLPL